MADTPALSPRLQALAEAGVARRYKAHTLLMQEGEPGGTLYFVEDGLLRAYTAHDDGREYTLGFFGAGETIGEVSLDGGPRSATVVVERAASCRMVTRGTIERRIADDPALAFDLIGLLARRLRRLTDNARELALTDAYGRLVLLLRAGAVPLPDGRQRMAYPLTQGQMAQQIGCSRPMVNRLLRDLVAGGYLAQETVGRQRLWVVSRPLPRRW